MTSCPSLCTSLKTSLADLHLSFFNGKARLFQLKVQAYCFFRHIVTRSLVTLASSLVEGIEFNIALNGV